MVTEPVIISFPGLADNGQAELAAKTIPPNGSFSYNENYMNKYQSLQIPFELPAGAGKSYDKVPFSVAANTEYIIIWGRYQVVEDNNVTVDIGLEDSDGQIRGWSGNLNRTGCIFIGEEQASLGYLAGPVTEGTWHILLGDNRQHQKSIQITLELELHPRRPRIVRGDIHGHSLYSDGEHSIETKLEMAQECGLDFLGFTDHNSISQNACLPINTDVLLLPSCEITTYDGHVNIFGYRQKRIPNFMCRSSAEVSSLLQGLKEEALKPEESGCAPSLLWIQLNHPIRLGDVAGCQWNWSYDMPFDWIEVWNGEWGANSKENVKLWQRFLEQGRYLPGAANSDFHSLDKRQQGYPCNNVWVGQKTAATIFSAMAKGHNYMTAEPLPERNFAARIYRPSAAVNEPQRFVAFGETIEDFVSSSAAGGAALGLQLTCCQAYLMEQPGLLLRTWCENGLLWQMELPHPAFVPVAETERTDALVDEHDCSLLLELQADGSPLSTEAKGRLLQCPVARVAAEATALRFLRFELLRASAGAEGKTANESMLLLTNPVFWD